MIKGFQQPGKLGNVIDFESGLKKSGKSRESFENVELLTKCLTFYSFSDCQECKYSGQTLVR